MAAEPLSVHVHMHVLRFQYVARNLCYNEQTPHTASGVQEAQHTPNDNTHIRFSSATVLARLNEPLYWWLYAVNILI